MSKILQSDSVYGGQRYVSEELKKLEREGAGALSCSELHYMYSTFCSLGYNHINPHEAKILARTLTIAD